MRFAPDRVATRMAVVAFVGVALGLSACSDDLPTDYTAAHREAFLAACSRPIDDPRLLSDVCACVYDRIEDELPFAQFQQMSERLTGTSTTTTAPVDGTDTSDDPPPTTAAALPDEIAPLVADCFTVEADL